MVNLSKDMTITSLEITLYNFREKIKPNTKDYVLNNIYRELLPITIPLGITSTTGKGIVSAVKFWESFMLN